MTNQMQQLLGESEVAFRNQFEPGHPNYHGGDPTPVPIGGGRVPEGCDEEVAAEAAPSSVLLPDSLPSEYHSLQREREQVGKIKAGVCAASRALGALHSTPAGSRKKVEAEAEMKAAIDQLEKLADEYKKQQRGATTEAGANNTVVTSAVEQMCKMCSTVPDSHEAYGDFVLETQRLNGQLFKEQNRLLQEMKEIKKNATMTGAAAAEK